MTAELKIHRVLDLSVEAQKSRKVSCPIFAPDEVPVLIESREGKSGVYVKYWNKVKLIRQSNHIPEEASVRCIRPEWAILVRPNEGIRIVAKKLVVVIEFAIGV